MAKFIDSNGADKTKIFWTAPTQNIDGSPIVGALTYNLYVDDAHVLSFPGELNADGKYEFPLGDIPVIEDPGSYVFELTAVNEDGGESDRSNSIVVTSVATPKAIADLALG